MTRQDLEQNDSQVSSSSEGEDDIPAGVEKLQEFCCAAAKCGFRWAWTDTCCINKQDYAEASESLNTMFKWYRCSALTIVYLHDVDDDIKDCGGRRKRPSWVDRGWTLQEMLAAKSLRFYSKEWTLLEETARLIDHRKKNFWSRALSRTTGVPGDDLVNFKTGTDQVRLRLRWAARRTTTKVEDMAYCLLGIFDVSLPVMYGEGPRAFVRLQEELMKRTGDLSLFDW
ncbi:hypothetical protein HYDPIDRAFT_94357, partial [Hydnomerulius pinastri MD-312]